MSPERYTHLAAAAADLLDGRPALRLRWGFEVLINGIVATPRHDVPTA